MSGRRKECDWVVVGGAPGELAHCRRCGEALRLELPAAAEVVIAALDAFNKVHSKCTGPIKNEPRPISPEEWAASRAVGTSSLTIYHVMTGRPTPDGRFSVPHDPADFGRCMWFLELFPHYRFRLAEVAQRFPEWAGLVREWDVLEAMYRAEAPSGKAPKLYARMRELIGGC